MGTPDFSVPCLYEIVQAGHEVVGVFTQQDKKMGRRQAVCAHPVKNAATKLEIPVFQPGTLRDGEAVNVLNELAPEIIVVVAYGKILPAEIINLPPSGCINVHASLLPKYRGAAPIHRAVINGEVKTGVTTMQMDEGLDTGDILLYQEIDISEDETSGELYERLSKVGASLLVRTLAGLESGDITRVSQDGKLSTYAEMIDKTMAEIDFHKNAVDIHNLVRGLNPWPVAFTMLGDQVLKIYKTHHGIGADDLPGTVKSITPLCINCGENTFIEILEVQVSGKNRMSESDFLRGYKGNLSVGKGLKNENRH